jgi:hypothetical protein
MFEGMKVKLMGAGISRELVSDSVQIHGGPVIAQVPTSPNVTLNLVLGVGPGLRFSPVANSDCQDIARGGK